MRFNSKLARGLAPDEHADLDRLWKALSTTSAMPSRRDFLRWSAIAAGAVVTAREGILSTRPRVARAQDAPIVEGAEITVPFDAFGQVVNLDPHRSSDYGGFWVMYPNVWNGFLRYDENGRIALDLAEKISRSADGLRYTCTIREGATYASGNPVLAEHFVSSWLRALDPANLSPMVAFMEPLKGFDAWIGGDTSVQPGFSATDDRTVVVELERPVTFFPSFFAAFVWSVVEPQAIADFGDINFVLNSAGAGPWQFTAYQQDTQFVMEPNPNYYGELSPSIAKITWPIVNGPEAASSSLSLYIDENAASTDVPLSLLGDVTSDETLAAELKQLNTSQATIRSLAMDFRQAPFNDVRVRRAFGLAFDRDRYSEIYDGAWTPASVFTPPVVNELSGYAPPEGFPFDPDQAQALLAEAGFPGGEGLPEIVYYLASGESDAEVERMQQVLQIFQDNLGVAITLDNSLTQAEINDLIAETGGLQFSIMWWQTVTDTPFLLSDVFRPDSPYMQGVFNWSPDLEALGGDPGAAAQQFADLVGRADIELDQATRNDLYRQAETLVLENAVYVPIGNWVPMFLQKPWLSGTRQGPWTGRLPALFDQNVVVLQQ
ncbi:MAG: peptide ABC transporter substrate-binding protein [Thermomicrobiales bacterium]|nr:peptide ABC transporter substrate-binding protein [Thermomicrobiales bacterium]